MNEQEQRAVMTISLMAAYADGQKDDREREQIRSIFESLSPESPIDMPALYRDVLLGKRKLEDAAEELTSLEARQFAYEMAVGVCDADGVPSPAEAEFLERLRAALGLEAAPAREFAHQAEEVASTALEAAPPSPPAVDMAAPAIDTAALDRIILNYSILNGALELLPQSLASMAILPLQTRMVYRVGKAYGYNLDAGHIKDFAATLGVGLAGQYIEQIGRKLLKGFLRKAGGGMLGGLGGAAAGSAFSFATTYALGQAARQYYAGGRTISMDRLKQMFASMLDQGKGLQSRYAGEIAERARTIDVSQIPALIRQQ